ncbi:Glycosyltransferase involved in cell wall bisynthesis [Planococcus glaciei]|uniref:glycosyltransferase family 4 protein n=1 Tax=Planococcus glaciei TaxID=459472 RepID=UPI000880ACAB|nr:glycosyltransferase family 4 protein [Planococcus glaciei]SDH87424.1 Glycosyltransferase involved in cell wall bisynthesis [Planococcus glaciei]
MKILLVCQYFYPERFRVNDICFELVKQGHEVTVLTGLPNYPDGVVKEEYKKVRYEEINGVKVFRSWLLGRGSSNKTLFLNYLSFAISASLKALSLKGNFDKIIVYQLSPVTMAIPAIVAKKKFKIPLIMYTHDLWPESIVSGGITSKGTIYKSVKRLSKKIYKQADEIWLSSQMFKYYFNDYLEIDKQMTHLPVYAEDLFGSIPQREKDGEINLLFAGNIGEMQSVETILLAANELKERNDIVFHIVGDGSSKKRCEELKKEYHLENVKFHGSHPLEEMPYYYSIADAFLITLKDNKSISYTLPNKVQSYMAAGKPILGAINGETAKVVNQAECGFIVEAENHYALAKTIEKFVDIKNKEYLYRNSKEFYSKNYSKENYFINLSKALNN